MNVQKIEELDPNFAAVVDLPEGLEFFDIFSEPFELNGLCRPAETRQFCRLPQEFLPQCSEGVQILAWNTSGGRLRFSTDSPIVAVAVELSGHAHMMHMPRTGNSGFDLYVSKKGAPVSEQKFIRTFFPFEPVKEIGVYYTGSQMLPVSPSEITLNFPLYNGVKKLSVGLKAGSHIWAPVPYRIEKPVVFYGSSITQGGCASRPGNNYICHLSRWLDFDYTCLGFSGNAKGEQSMAEYIASLPMSAFVMDYDHNAPTADFLKETHFSFYETIRRRQPDLPVLMISRPNFTGSADDLARRNIVMESYLRGRQNGDHNLYFVDGAQLFGHTGRDACTVDGCHPNDLGFYRMAETILPHLKAALHL